LPFALFQTNSAPAIAAPKISGERMNWKTDLKLADLDPATRLEVTYKRCGLSRYEQQAALMPRPEFKQAYLDEEVKRARRCTDRLCKGAYALL
jgi:hypothetical protein